MQSSRSLTKSVLSIKSSRTIIVVAACAVSNAFRGSIVSRLVYIFYNGYDRRFYPISDRFQWRRLILNSIPNSLRLITPMHRLIYIHTHERSLPLFIVLPVMFARFLWYVRSSIVTGNHYNIIIYNIYCNIVLGPWGSIVPEQIARE